MTEFFFERQWSLRLFNNWTVKNGQLWGLTRENFFDIKTEYRLLTATTFAQYFYIKVRPCSLFLETPDNFPGPESVSSSSVIYQLMVIIGANLWNMLHEDL